MVGVPMYIARTDGAKEFSIGNLNGLPRFVARIRPQLVALRVRLAYETKY